PGLRDGEAAQFYEPGGLSIANGKMYIADTNNHAIRVVDMSSKRVATLQLVGFTEHGVGTVADIWPNLEEIHTPEQKVKPGQSHLTLAVEIPAPYKLNPGSPLEYRVDGQASPSQLGKRVTVKDGKFPLQIPLALTEGQTELRAAVSFVYCRDGNEGVCIIKSVRWTIPVKASPDGQDELRVTYPLIPLQLENQDRPL